MEGECLLRPCVDPGGDFVVLTQKGLGTVKAYSKEKQDGLATQLEDAVNIRVHVKCRKKYTRIEPVATTTTRQITPRTGFDFKSQCLFCAKVCTDASKFRNSVKHEWSAVQTLHAVETIWGTAHMRPNCPWAVDVLTRLSATIDLVADEGRYHRQCYRRFLNPGSTVPGEKDRSGRQSDVPRFAAFESVCKFIEDNEECQFALNDLISKMKAFDPSVEPYSSKHFRNKLNERYGENVRITDGKGSCTVVCFTGTTDKVLTEKWYIERQTIEVDEKKRIVVTAAKLLRKEILSQQYDCDVYPSDSDINTGDNDLSCELLSAFFDTLMCPKKITTENNMQIKKKSLQVQHGIVAALRPRSFISPLQLGLSVYLHRRFASKTLVEVLSNLGVCSSYKETLHYESAVTLHSQPIDESGYVQFVYDNADHNVHTLDGLRTFHAMGSIKCVTPGTAVEAEKTVPRKLPVDTSSIAKEGLTELTFFHKPLVVGYSLVYVADVLAIPLESPSVFAARRLDTLWMSGAILDVVPRATWSGFMSRVCQPPEGYDVSSVLPLPFIYNDPTNVSNIYTSLLQAANCAIQRKQKHIMVTFVQPLYAKATEIVLAAEKESPLSRVIVRLGGFHLLMSFMRAIGQIMAGSGLEELWETIYGRNTVVHMLHGRAYSRAFRAHILSVQAVATLLLEKNLRSAENISENDLRETYEDLFAGRTAVTDAVSSESVVALEAMLRKDIESSTEDRTRNLWCLYVRMVGVMMMFVRAERCGDWNLHLYSVQQMLPFFHSAGHLNYAKSAHLYLQQMVRLETVMDPTEFDKFARQGYFTVRRTDNFWSGIWSDMTIEQVLMRSMKSVGGLTHGRGVSPATLAKWVSAMPATTKIVESIEDFGGVTKMTSEQHQHNPFARSSPVLSSLSNGVIGEDPVNCEAALDVGITAIQGMVGKKFHEVHLRRKDAVKSLATVTKAVKIRGTEICINPSQLFHRLVCLVRSDDDLADSMSYELAVYPPSLFDDTGMRKGKKSSLVPLIEEIVPCEQSLPPNPHFVVDGGHLLHRVEWTRPATYGQICQQYVSYLEKRYGRECHVAFDGYDSGPSTKDAEHSRRGRNTSGPDVVFDDATNISMSKHEFRANAANKSRFISLLRQHLISFHVLVADNDADTRIVSTVTSLSEQGKRAVIVGDDTDLLVIMIARATSETFMFMPGMKTTQRKIISSAKLQEGLGDVAAHVLFLHAFTGCDTTSASFNKGKKMALKRLREDVKLQNKVAVFNDHTASPEAVSATGETFFLVMYGAKARSSLNDARFHAYNKTIASQRVSGSFNLATLPPTSEAARQHSFRTYHQVQLWRGFELDPLLWGWKLQNSRYCPIPTLKEPAPQSLLQLIACNCKSGCERNCDCKRHGLTCSAMCGHCAGNGCSNSTPMEAVEDSDDSEFEADIEPDDENDDDARPSPPRRRCLLL